MPDEACDDRNCMWYGVLVYLWTILLCTGIALSDGTMLGTAPVPEHYYGRPQYDPVYLWTSQHRRTKTRPPGFAEGRCVLGSDRSPVADALTKQVLEVLVVERPGVAPETHEVEEVVGAQPGDPAQR